MDERPELVRNVALAAERLQFGNDIVHLAITYVDRFRAIEPVQGHVLQVVALVALVVAAKFQRKSKTDEEGYFVDLTFSYVLDKFDNPAGVTRRHLATIERRLLNVLQWRLLMATPSSFASAYRARGIFCLEDTAGPLLDTPPTLEEHQRVWEFTTFFCNLATLHGLSCTQGISVAAGAAVAGARYIVGIHPAWPEHLALWLCLPGDTQRVVMCTVAMLDLYHTEYEPGREGEQEAKEEEAKEEEAKEEEAKEDDYFQTQMARTKDLTQKSCKFLYK